MGTKFFVKVANFAGDSGDMSAHPKLMASQIASGLDCFQRKVIWSVVLSTGNSCDTAPIVLCHSSLSLPKLLFLEATF